MGQKPKAAIRGRQIPHRVPLNVQQIPRSGGLFNQPAAAGLLTITPQTF